MARIQQFADDLGITYKEAKKLIEMGRNTKDSGSSAMDKARSRMNKRVQEMKKNQKKADQIASDDTNMKLKAKEGKSVKITGPKARPNAEDRFQLEGGFDHDAYKKALEREDKTEKYMEKAPKRSAKLKRRGDDEKAVMAKDGKYMRGMGKACMRPAKEVKIR